jgi:nitric-oxide synthase
MSTSSGEESLSNQSIYNNSGALMNVRFSVFGLGNSSYPKYCSFAKFLDACFSELGAERIHELGLGDELCGQEESFRRWCANAFKVSNAALIYLFLIKRIF